MNNGRTTRRLKLKRQQMDQALLAIITSVIIGLPILCCVVMVLLQACATLAHSRLFHGR
jgi:hypothetical protein